MSTSVLPQKQTSDASPSNNPQESDNPPGDLDGEDILVEENSPKNIVHPKKVIFANNNTTKNFLTSSKIKFPFLFFAIEQSDILNDFGGIKKLMRAFKKELKILVHQQYKLIILFSRKVDTIYINNVLRFFSELMFPNSKENDKTNTFWFAQSIVWDTKTCSDLIDKILLNPSKLSFIKELKPISLKLPTPIQYLHSKGFTITKQQRDGARDLIIKLLENDVSKTFSSNLCKYYNQSTIAELASYLEILLFGSVYESLTEYVSTYCHLKIKVQKLYSDFVSSSKASLKKQKVDFSSSISSVTIDEDSEDNEEYALPLQSMLGKRARIPLDIDLPGAEYLIRLDELTKFASTKLNTKLSMDNVLQFTWMYSSPSIDIVKALQGLHTPQIIEMDAHLQNRVEKHFRERRNEIITEHLPGFPKHINVDMDLDEMTITFQGKTLKALARVMKFQDSILDVPPHWLPVQTEAIEVFSTIPDKYNQIIDDEIYNIICDMIHESMPNAKINYIYQIQNCFHLQNFNLQQQTISANNNSNENFSLNVENLFFGSNIIPPESIIGGIDGIPCHIVDPDPNQNWGAGIHHSPDARYADERAFQYLDKNGDKRKQIFLNSVILGNTFKQKPDTNLKRPSKRHDINGMPVSYDSILGDYKFSRKETIPVKVVYKSVQVLPSFLIDYTLGPKTKS